MKQGKQFWGMLLMAFVAVLLVTPAHASAKQIKITSTTDNVMHVGQSKTIKANQKVTWHSMNKKLKITTKEKGKKVKIRAIKKGIGIITARTDMNTARVRIKIKEKSDVKQQVESESDVDTVVNQPDEEMMISKQYFVKSISGNKIGLSETVAGDTAAYATIEDTTVLTGADAITISKEDLRTGQYVLVEYSSIRETFPAVIVDCRSVTVLVDSGEILLTVKQSDKADKTLVLTVSNKTGVDIFIGRAFRLEKFEDGIWKDVDFRVGANKFTEEAIVVRSGGDTVLTVALDSYFDGIGQGKYRISKQIFSSYVICAEFTFDTI